MTDKTDGTDWPRVVFWVVFWVLTIWAWASIIRAVIR